VAAEIQIRLEQPADYENIFRIHELAFKRPDEGHLVDKIRKSDSYIPDLSYVAVQDGQIVGHVLFSRVRIDTAAGPKPVLALAPLAVHPDHQKEGIGSKLTRTAIADAKKMGWTAVIVLGQPTYYPRFGFQPAHEFGIESPFPLNDPSAFMALELQDGALEGSEGMVVYPDFFIEID
jgi:putative acetyltransferase